MEHQDTLLTIAEVAVALTGFTGIAVALGGRSTILSASQRITAPIGAVIGIALIVSSSGLVQAASSVFIVGILWQLFVASQNFVLLLVEGVSRDD